MDTLEDKEVKGKLDINIPKELEDEYPFHDRRLQGYKLIGFDKKARPRNKRLYPYGAVPVWRYLGYDLNNKYDGEKLRELRKERGVGKWKKK